MQTEHDTPMEETGSWTAGAGNGDAAASAYDVSQLRAGLWWEGIRSGGVLLLHDIGVTPEGLAGLALGSYYQGFWTAAPLLPGHEHVGSDGGRLGTVSLSDTLASVDRWATALQASTHPLVVVGCGLGASLAVLVANTYTVSGLVTVNMPLSSYRRRRFRARLASMAVGRAMGLVADVKAEHGTEAQAGFLSRDAFSLACELERLAAAELHAVAVPTLLFQSREDHVVAPRDGAEILGLIGTNAKELVWLERSFHQAWIDHDATVVTDRVGAFVRALVERRALPRPPAPAPDASWPQYGTEWPPDSAT